MNIEELIQSLREKFVPGRFIELLEKTFSLEKSEFLAAYSKIKAIKIPKDEYESLRRTAPLGDEELLEAVLEDNSTGMNKGVDYYGNNINYSGMSEVDMAKYLAFSEATNFSAAKLSLGARFRDTKTGAEFQVVSKADGGSGDRHFYVKILKLGSSDSGENKVGDFIGPYDGISQIKSEFIDHAENPMENFSSSDDRAEFLAWHDAFDKDEDYQSHSEMFDKLYAIMGNDPAAEVTTLWDKLDQDGRDKVMEIVRANPAPKAENMSISKKKRPVRNFADDPDKDRFLRWYDVLNDDDTIKAVQSIVEPTSSVEDDEPFETLWEKLSAGQIAKLMALVPENFCNMSSDADKDEFWKWYYKQGSEVVSKVNTIIQETTKDETERSWDRLTDDQKTRIKAIMAESPVKEQNMSSKIAWNKSRTAGVKSISPVEFIQFSMGNANGTPICTINKLNVLENKSSFIKSFAVGANLDKQIDKELQVSFADADQDFEKFKTWRESLDATNDAQLISSVDTILDEAGCKTGDSLETNWHTCTKEQKDALIALIPVKNMADVEEPTQEVAATTVEEVIAPAATPAAEVPPTPVADAPVSPENNVVVADATSAAPVVVAPAASEPAAVAAMPPVVAPEAPATVTAPEVAVAPTPAPEVVTAPETAPVTEKTAEPVVPAETVSETIVPENQEVPPVVEAKEEEEDEDLDDVSFSTTEGYLSDLKNMSGKDETNSPSKRYQAILHRVARVR